MTDWLYEDDLPDGYPYNTMYPQSRVVDGVRMFPPCPICDYCGKRFDRPGCEDERHVTPDMAQRIVAAIEDDLRDRRGLRQAFESIDDELQVEIRDTWAALVREISG